MRITLILANTLRTEIALIHENESRPYERRTVTLQLTDEQIAAIRPRFVGSNGGADRYEEILNVFIDEEIPESTPLSHPDEGMNGHE